MRVPCLLCTKRDSVASLPIVGGFVVQCCQPCQQQSQVRARSGRACFLLRSRADGSCDLVTAAGAGGGAQANKAKFGNAAKHDFCSQCFYNKCVARCAVGGAPCRRCCDVCIVCLALVRGAARSLARSKRTVLYRDQRIATLYTKLDNATQLIVDKDYGARWRAAACRLGFLRRSPSPLLHRGRATPTTHTHTLVRTHAHAHNIRTHARTHADKARLRLQKLVQECPGLFAAHYNLACIESLAGNAQESLGLFVLS